jgi:hypothetical protein
MTTAHRFSFVRGIAAVSGVYDTAVGLFLLLAAERLASLFGVSPAHPPIFSDLNGLFLVAVGVGYYWPYRDPEGARWYLWLMGPGLKGAGAITFVIDYLVRHSPASFLLFAACDGALAILTFAALSGMHSRPALPRR